MEKKIQINLLPCYSYYFDWVKAINDNVKFEKFNRVVNGGGRYSGKTQNAFLFALSLFLSGASVAIFIFKNMKNEVQDSIWAQILAMVQTYDDLVRYKYTINKNNFTIRYRNSFIRCYGLHTMQRDKIAFKGYGSLAQRHVINIFEEALEINPDDVSAVNIGQRGIQPLINRFNIMNFNPDLSTAQIANEFTASLPEDELLLSKKGEQKKIVNGTMYHRTNRRVNPFYDGKSVQEQTIQNLKLMDPELFKSWDLGMAGIGRQGVFTHVLKYIERRVPEERLIAKSREFFGGVDFGFRHDAFAFVLCGISEQNDAIAVISEFYFENEKRGLSHSDIAKMLISHIISMVRKLQTNVMGPKPIMIRCDSSDYAFMEFLIDESMRRNMQQFIQFQISKKPKIEFRIGHLMELIGRGDFLMNKERTQNLYNEFVLSKGKDQGELKFVDANNHLMDALGYAIFPYLNQLGTKNLFELKQYG